MEPPTQSNMILNRGLCTSAIPMPLVQFSLVEGQNQIIWLSSNPSVALTPESKWSGYPINPLASTLVS